MSYKELSKFEKLAEIQDLRLGRQVERHDAAVYLRALWLNDEKMIQKYERFGDDARKILMNKRQFDRGLLFGFNGIEFDEHGWLVKPKLLDFEEIEFKDKKGFMNGITIGRGKNGKWTYGSDASHSTSGRGYRACIWCNIVDSREKAIEAAIGEVIAWHQAHESDVSKNVTKLATEFLQSIKPQPQPLQLQLL